VDKNNWLRAVRGVVFDDVLFHIQAGDLLDVIEHGVPRKYPGQRIFVVAVDGYVYLVPFVETKDVIFPKTVIPSRKMTKRYLGSTRHESD
jgi:hypothetical protein